MRSKFIYKSRRAFQRLGGEELRTLLMNFLRVV